jgi:hypothetical protein
VVACPSGAGNPFAHLEKAVHADRSVVDQIRGLQEKQRILMKILHFAAPFYAAMTYRNTATASGHYAINPHQVPSLSLEYRTFDTLEHRILFTPSFR